MYIESVEDYVWMKKCSLDLQELKNSCFKMNDIIVENFGDKRPTYNAQSTLSTKLYSEYNVLLYPFPQFHQLYNTIKNTFWEVNKNPEENYYMQCWLNFYRKDDCIGIHTHYPKGKGGWHGYFCVDTEPSITSYLMPNGNRYDINNKDNHLIIGKSEGDEHRTWPWPYENRIRITIAFDIAPARSLVNDRKLNHWIPL
jgi:hypothetical protein